MKLIFKLNPSQQSDRPSIIIELTTKDSSTELSLTILTENSALFIQGIKSKLTLTKVINALGAKDSKTKAEIFKILVEEKDIKVDTFYGEQDLISFMSKQKIPIVKVDFESNELKDMFDNIERFIDANTVWNYILKTGYVVLLS